MKALKALLLLVVIGALAGAAAVGGVLLYFSQSLPRIHALRDYKPNVITEVYAETGVVIDQFYVERREIVPPEKIPTLVKNAFVAAEDADFYRHTGVDFVSILRAALKNLEAGRTKQGGSTITQQVVKTLFLTNEKTYTRKIREALLAWRLENRLTKDEILFLYLNQIYLGHGNYGVQAAAKDFFGKSVEGLTLAQAALIAGLPPAPSAYSPHLNLDAAVKRQHYVLGRMVEQGYITEAEAEEARKDKLGLLTGGGEVERLAPYFTEQVRQEVQDRYTSDVLYKQGLKVYTTLDPNLQRIANAAVRKGLREVDARQGYHGVVEHVDEAGRRKWAEDADAAMKDAPPAEGDRLRAIVAAVAGKSGLELALGSASAKPEEKSLAWASSFKGVSQTFRVGDVVEVEVRKLPGPKGEPYEVALVQEPEVQGALVALDPRTGAVRAMVGGYDFERSKWNRAVQAVRQPGSAFKPIIYAAALDKGFTPATVVIDAPIVYDDPWLNDVWKPKNFDQKFHGPTTIRKAITHSRNVVTIKVLKAVTPKYAVQYAAGLGIASKLEPNLSLALGSSGVTPLELARAYAVFASGGDLPVAHLIEKVEDREGYTLEKFDGKPTAAISPQTAFLMTNMLSGVVNEGTAARARQALGTRPAAGKTGTTNNSNDAWFIGYTPDLLAAVWVGYDKETTLRSRETGGRAALPIWIDFMKAALEGTPETAFTPPDKIVFRQIDAATGQLPRPGTEKSITEAFLEGTAPIDRGGDDLTHAAAGEWTPPADDAGADPRALYGADE